MSRPERGSGLPEKGLVNAAQALVQAMEGAGDRREEYWKNRVAPFWRNVWPKSKELLSKPLAEQLARLTIAAGGEFPAALNEVKHWLLQLDHPNYTVHLLSESGLCSRFPKESLTLLNLAIASNNVPPLDLSNCLDSIKKSFPGAEYDLAYKALVNYIG